MTEGPDLNSYYHEMFLRGLPDLCAKMRRPVKHISSATKDLSEYPDFYKISMFAPLPDPNAPATEKAAPDSPISVSDGSNYSMRKRTSSHSFTSYSDPDGSEAPLESPSSAKTPEADFDLPVTPPPRSPSFEDFASPCSWNDPEEVITMWDNGFIPTDLSLTGHDTGPEMPSNDGYDDTAGLSVADLCYLSEQNHKLLFHASV
jgi:hypothetical protein